MSEVKIEKKTSMKPERKLFIETHKLPWYQQLSPGHSLCNDYSRTDQVSAETVMSGQSERQKKNNHLF